MNIFEKILARASGKKIVEPNEIVEANIDMAMMHDLTGPLTIDSFRKIGVKKIWDPERIVTIFDHLVPANTIRAASLHKTIREFVEEQNIKNFYENILIVNLPLMQNCELLNFIILFGKHTKQKDG